MFDNCTFSFQSRQHIMCVRDSGRLAGYGWSVVGVGQFFMPPSCRILRSRCFFTPGREEAAGLAAGWWCLLCYNCGAERLFAEQLVIGCWQRRLCSCSSRALVWMLQHWVTWSGTFLACSDRTDWTGLCSVSCHSWLVGQLCDYVPVCCALKACRLQCMPVACTCEQK